MIYAYVEATLKNVRFFKFIWDPNSNFFPKVSSAYIDIMKNSCSTKCVIKLNIAFRVANHYSFGKNCEKFLSPSKLINTSFFSVWKFWYSIMFTGKGSLICWYNLFSKLGSITSNGINRSLIGTTGLDTHSCFPLKQPYGISLNSDTFFYLIVVRLLQI